MTHHRLSGGTRLRHRRQAITTATSAALLVIAGLGLGASPVARADDDAAKAAAKAKLASGAQMLDKGDYAQALADFQEAYRLLPNPKILFNIGLANVGLAHYPDALGAFERFAAEVKTAPGTTLSDAQKQIESLRPKVAVVEIIAQPPGVDLFIDGRALGKAPLAAPVYIDPGEHRVLAQPAEGAAPVVQAFTIGGGERRTLTVVAPVPVANPVAAAGTGTGTGAQPTVTAVVAGGGVAAGTDQERRPIHRKPWFWAVVGGGVLAVGLTVLLLSNQSTEYPNASFGHVSGN